MNVLVRRLVLIALLEVLGADWNVSQYWTLLTLKTQEKRKGKKKRKNNKKIKQKGEKIIKKLKHTKDNNKWVKERKKARRQ
jgi:hypothetical protein